MSSNDAMNRVSIRPDVGTLALFANLNYKPWFALAEFVDNALQSYLTNRERLESSTVHAYCLKVELDIPIGLPARIVVKDNAAGIASSDFPRAFKAAEPPPDRTGLSEFGVGMKSAAFWFASDWSVRTLAVGDDVERSIRFNLTEIISKKLEDLSISERPVEYASSYTEVSLNQLHKAIAPKTRTKIREHLESIYRKFIRSGQMSVLLNGELLSYEQPEPLIAPFFKTPDAKSVEWQKEIFIDLGNGRSISGNAGLRAKGSASKAGFALFRNNRLIQGSADDSYRPEAIFRKSNSYTYQRLFGELNLYGFDVTHTKDGFIWGDSEDDILDELKAQLDHGELPLLQQAEGYRSRQRANEQVAQSALTAAVESTVKVVGDAEPLSSDVIATELKDDERPADSEPESIPLVSRSLDVRYGGDIWRVSVELVNDPSLRDWLILSDKAVESIEGKREIRNIKVQVVLSHPFMTRFVGANNESFEAIFRIAVGLALSEVAAREGGLRGAGLVRANLNHLLATSLCEA